MRDRIHNMQGKNQGKMPKKYSHLGSQYDENKIKGELLDRYKGVMGQYTAMVDFVRCSISELKNQKDSVRDAICEGKRFDVGEMAEANRLEFAYDKALDTSRHIEGLLDEAMGLKEQAEGRKTRKGLESGLINFKDKVDSAYADFANQLMGAAIFLTPKVTPLSKPKEDKGPLARSQLGADDKDDPDAAAKLAEYGEDKSVIRRVQKKTAPSLMKVATFLHLLGGGAGFVSDVTHAPMNSSPVAEIRQSPPRDVWKDISDVLKSASGTAKSFGSPKGKGGGWFFDIPLFKTETGIEFRKKLGINKKKATLFLGRERFDYVE